MTNLSDYSTIVSGDGDMVEVVKCTIMNRSRIPFLNRLGPIVRPTPIKRSVAEKLLRMGYDVRLKSYKPANSDKFSTVTDFDELDSLALKAAEPIVENIRVEEVASVVAEVDNIMEETAQAEAEQPVIVIPTYTAEPQAEEAEEELDEEEQLADQFRSLTVRQLSEQLLADEDVPEDVKEKIGKSIKLKDDLVELATQYLAN